MKTISELDLGFGDAENYRRREYKELFNQIFLKTEHLQDLSLPSKSFLIGEKGTGKTAYAVYMSNNNLDNTHSTLKFLRETDYKLFLKLKTAEHLTLSDYSSIWKVILYLLFGNEINSQPEGAEWMGRHRTFGLLQQAIDTYYAGAFAPEIKNAMSFVQNSRVSAELVSKVLHAGGAIEQERSFSETGFQTNLLYIQKMFEQALVGVKLVRSHLLFIDGIDIRPSGVNFDDYLDCIKGLAQAVWEVNNDFFPSIKDSKGRLRVVLLLRPDIFDKLGLQNQNTKARDNSVYLDWRTTYPKYRTSALFRVADQLLSAQQNQVLPEGAAWDHYFPYKISSGTEPSRKDDSFIQFLRYSYFRPRDIVILMAFLRQECINAGDHARLVFSDKDFFDSSFLRSYSDYLSGELKDHLSFYYTSLDTEEFLNFFSYLNGKNGFDYREFKLAYDRWQDYLKGRKIKNLRIAASPDEFLQLLYDLNVICYIEETADEHYVRWCFRQRTLTNISPKVKVDCRYYIHYGLAKALNVGKRISGNNR